MIMKKNIKYLKWVPKGKATDIVVFVHGFAGDKNSSVVDAVATSLAKHGILSVAFDLPCHGEDELYESFSLGRCFSYLNQVIDDAKTYNLPISIFATSFGGFLTLNYLKNPKVVFKNIILRAPAIFMADILENKIVPEHGYDGLGATDIDLGYSLPILIGRNFVKELKENSLSDLRLDLDLNIIQGKKDEIVDYKENEKFLLAHITKPCKFYYFENADHRFKNAGELEKIVETTTNIMIGGEKE